MKGGYKVFPATSIPALISATNTFSNTNTDPKASIIVNLGLLAGVPTPVLLLFYDGPTEPAAFAPFKNIPTLQSDVKTRSFSDLAKSSPSQTTSGQRGAFHTLSTTGYTLGFLNAVNAESVFYGQLALSHSGVFISYDIEPFVKAYGQKATDSAYPHQKSPLPLFLYFTWLNPAEDAFWRTKIQESVDKLTQVAKAEGIFDAELTSYPNYVLGTYKGDQLYGSANAARLRGIRGQVDPSGVMDLTGGFVT